MTPARRQALKELVGIMLAAETFAIPAQETVKSAERPLRIVVPASPGGPIDTWARLVAETMAAQFGRAVLVENKPGGNGIVGAIAVLQAPADGNTIYMTTTGTLVVPTLLVRPKPFELEQFASVAAVSRSTLLLLLHPSVPAKTVPDLAAYMKANADRFTAGNAGKGTTGELLLAQFADRAGAQLLQAPYKGGAPALQALIGNEVQMTVVEMSQAMPFVKAGRVRVVAQFGTQRDRLLPDVPTVSESLLGLEGILWVGMLVRADTPAATVAALNHRLNQVLAAGTVRERAARMGAQIEGGTPQHLDDLIAKDLRELGFIVEKYKITAD